MKIACESCGSKYALDDSKVVGKTKKFGVKCPGCGSVIVVDPAVHVPGQDDEAEAAAPPAPPPPPPKAKPKTPPAAPPPADDLDIPEPPSASSAVDPFEEAMGSGGGVPPPAADSEDPFAFDTPAPPAAPPPTPPPQAAPPPPPAEEAPSDPFDFGNVDFAANAPPSPPPAAAAPPPPPQSAPPPPAAPSDPFDFGNVDMGGGGEQADSGGGAEFDFGTGGGGGASASAPDTSGMDDLDRMDAEIEAKAAGRGAAAPPDDFFGVDAGASVSYRLKNPRGQVAGPFTVEAVREFAAQGKFTGQEEISRNEGPWISTAIITSLPDVRRANLDKILQDASAMAAPEMDAEIGFTDEEIAAGPGKAVKKKKARGKGSKVAVLSFLVLLVLGIGAGGGWYWWTRIREIPLNQLTDAKISELVGGNRSASGERAAVSEQKLQEGFAILDRLAVEEFPAGEMALLTAIQKNPANHRAVAVLAQLQAAWGDMLDVPARLQRANSLGELALRSEPTLAEANVAVAEAARLSGKYDRAVQLATKAIEVGARMPGPYVALARALIDQRQNYDAAKEAVDKALAVEGEGQAALLAAGLLEERRDRSDAALGHYEKAIASRPGNAWPRYVKARYLAELERYAEAESALSEAVQNPQIAKVPALKAKLLVQQARIALAQGKTADAEEVLKAAEKAEPGRADVGVARGDFLFQTERYADALIEYEKAIKADPKYGLAHLRLGKTKLYLGDLAAAEDALQKARTLDPDNVEVRLFLGQLLSKKGDNGAAREEFRAVIVKEPDNANAHAEMGRVLAAEGNKEEAARMFAKAIDLDPNNANTYLTVGQIYADVGRISDAIAATGKALKLAPESIDAMVQLGRLSYEAKDYKNSIELLSRALKANPRSVQLLLDIAKAQRAIRDFAGAKQNLIAARELRATEAPVRYYLGRTFYDLGDFEGASNEFSRAVANDNRNPIEQQSPEYFYWYARSLMKENKFRDAKVQLDEAIKRREDYLEAHFLLGQVLEQMSLDQDARAEYEKVLQINPRYVDGLVALGTLLRQKERDAAMKYFREAIQYDSRNAMAAYRICELLMEARRWNDAIPKCQAAIRFDSNLCDSYIELGYAYENVGQIPQACRSWKSVLRCKGLSDVRREEVQGQLANCR